LCQKETLVPFEPREGLPVYCRDCMKKIKAGELQPVRGFVNPSAEKRKEASRSPLAALGIEFTETNNQKIVEKGQNTPIRGGFDNRKISSTQNKPFNKPQFFEKHRSGPSPMLKGLLTKIGVGKKDAESIKKIEELPIQEVKKDTPPAMSLSSLKNSDSREKEDKQIRHNYNQQQEIIKPTKEASSEHLNSLKDVLKNIPKKEEQIVKKVDVSVAPVFTPALVSTPKIEVPIAPTVSVTQAVPATSTVPPFVPKKPEPDNKWEKRVPEKEVPEEVLKKVLE